MNENISRLPIEEETFLIEEEKIDEISFHGFSSTKYKFNVTKDMSLEKGRS